MVPNGAGEVTVGKGTGVKVEMGVNIGEDSSLTGGVGVDGLMAVGAQALNIRESKHRVTRGRICIPYSNNGSILSLSLRSCIWRSVGQDTK